MFKYTYQFIGYIFGVLLHQVSVILFRKYITYVLGHGIDLYITELSTVCNHLNQDMSLLFFLSAYKDLQSRETTRNAAWQRDGWDEVVYYTGKS